MSQKYTTIQELCCICKNRLEDICIECQANSINNKLDCPNIDGTPGCNHTFHNHCMNRWLKSRAVCPLDNIDWKSNTKHCYLCDDSLYNPCIQCFKSKNSDCPTKKHIQGCERVYHQHCIDKKLEKRNKCPYCRNRWFIKFENNDESICDHCWYPLSHFKDSIAANKHCGHIFHKRCLSSTCVNESNKRNSCQICYMEWESL